MGENGGEGKGREGKGREGKQMRDLDSPVIPERARSGRPAEPHLYVDVALIHVVEVVEDGVALAAVEAHDAVGHGAVDPEGLPAGGRVNAD